MSELNASATKLFDRLKTQFPSHDAEELKQAAVRFDAALQNVGAQTTAEAAKAEMDQIRRLTTTTSKNVKTLAEFDDVVMQHAKEVHGLDGAGKKLPAVAPVQKPAVKASDTAGTNPGDGKKPVVTANETAGTTSTSTEVTGGKKPVATSNKPQPKVEARPTMSTPTPKSAFQQRLEAIEGHNDFAAKFVERPAGEIHPALLSETPSRLKFADSTGYEGVVGGISGEAASHEALEKAGKTVSDATKANLTERGMRAETRLHGEMVTHKRIAEQAEKAYFAELEAIKGNSSTAQAAREALTKEYEAFKNLHADRGAVISGTRDTVSKKAGNGLLGGSAEAIHETEAAALSGAAAEAGSAAKGAQALVTRAGPNAAAKELGMMTEKAYHDLGFLGKMKARVNANLNVASIDEAGKVAKSGIVGKSMKIGGAALGAVIGGYGLKDLGQVLGVVSPDTDEQGKEVPADTGKLFKAAAELTGAAALVYFTLLQKGKVVHMGK